MNKNLILVVTIIAVTCLIGLLIWTSNSRFVGLSSGDQAFEIDKRTGKTWFLRGGSKIEQKVPGNEETKKEEMLLPPSEATKVTGNASISRYQDNFSGKIYNGSNWIVTRMIINITVKERDGSLRWSRDFSTSPSYGKCSSLSTSDFSVAITGGEGTVDVSWYIKQVFGFTN